MKPYEAMALQLQAVVDTYMLKVMENIAYAKGCIRLAFRMANGANVDQSLGNSEMAYRKMIFAHKLIWQANGLEGGAKNIYKLAREISVTIPAYKQAMQQASIVVMTSFLQGPHNGTATRRNPFLAGKLSNTSGVIAAAMTNASAATGVVDLDSVAVDRSTLERFLAKDKEQSAKNLSSVARSTA